MTDREELDLASALAMLCAEFPALAECEQVPMAEASRRVLAQDLLAPFDLPAFPNSAMDGYAVRAADARRSVTLPIAGTAFAGHGYDGTVAPMTAIRITTGAPLPDGADAVIMQEDVRRDGDAVTLLIDAAPGMHVRPRGQHVGRGDRLIAAGTVLRAPEIGLATLVGATALTVIRQLRVGVVSTGDELVDPPTQPGSAGSFDGNRPMIASVCRSAGFRVCDFGICPDDGDAFRDLLARAAADADVLLIIGGSALGDADVVRQAARIRFLPLVIRPGRGVTFCTLPAGESRATVVLGLPGNAVATFVMFHLLAMPALEHIAGSRARLPLHIPVPLAEDLACDPGRVDYRRGRLERNATGDLVVRPLKQQGAGLLRTLVDADVLIAAGPERFYGAGTAVAVVPLAALPR